MMAFAMRGWWSVGTLAAGLLLAGCASEDESTTTTVSRSYNDPLLDRYASNFDYQKGDDGSTRIVSQRRSSFEGSSAEGFDKGFQGKSFRGKEVEKGPWWGRKGYEAQVWNGGKGAREGTKMSRFGSKRSTAAGRAARATGQRYGTNNYATGAASEQGSNRLGKPRDAMTENRRVDYPSPDVIGWEARREMNLEQTKGILGR